MKNFVTSWSKLSTFEGCPRKFWLLYASKHVEGEAIIPFQKSRALEEGNEKHELLENAINSLKRGSPINGSIQKHKFWQPWWRDLVTKLVRKCPQSWVEQKLGVDIHFEKCELNQWWQPTDSTRTPLMHGRIDVVFFNGKPFMNATAAQIIDWKSGKVRKSEDYSQLASQALLVFASIPDLEKIDTTYVFIDHEKKQTQTFTRSGDFEKLKNEFRSRINKLLEAIKEGNYPSSQDGCHWCPATAEHCDYAR